MRGLWLYRLDSRGRVNYRLRCLAWLEAQPAPATWSTELPPCPCSRPQAELDPRYRHSRGAERGAEPPPAAGAASTPRDVSDPVRVLRTASPSRAGAGVRCVYRGTSLLEGWQERAWRPPTRATAGKRAQCSLKHPWGPPMHQGTAGSLHPLHPSSRRRGAGGVRVVLPARGEAPVLQQVCREETEDRL